MYHFLILQKENNRPLMQGLRDAEAMCTRNLLWTLPFPWKQLSLGSFGITLQADSVLRKIHEVTPEINKHRN